MITFFPLKPVLTPGDLVLVVDSSNSRNEALDWLVKRAPSRVRLNQHILTVRTLPIDAHRSLTSVRIGSF
jgi:hypothetical protein